jgi:hypothetical protein
MDCDHAISLPPVTSVVFFIASHFGKMWVSGRVLDVSVIPSGISVSGVVIKRIMLIKSTDPHSRLFPVSAT